MIDEEETVTIPRAEYEKLLGRAASSVVLGGRVPLYVQVAVYDGSAELRASIIYSNETVEHCPPRAIQPGDILRIEFQYKNKLATT